jgi:ABC-type antimicrobial peptide transport system permease subunit
MKEPLWVLMAGTLLLLLLSCANVANLFLARGAARMGEVTTRLALGASRSRITGPLLSESLLIALGGGRARSPGCPLCL